MFTNKFVYIFFILDLIRNLLLFCQFILLDASDLFYLTLIYDRKEYPFPKREDRIVMFAFRFVTVNFFVISFPHGNSVSIGL